MNAEKPNMPRMGWHFDFHSHKDIRINHNPDVATFARTLSGSGVAEIITFAKGHHGFAYYPSDVGTVHPKMKGDAFGDIVAACKAEGIDVLAYISFGIDGEAGRQHPDWLRMDAPDKPHFLTEDWFSYVCPFTSYMDELVLPMLAEIVEAYPVDGFFFDTMGALNTCYCSSCRNEFTRLYGRDIPANSEDEDWGLYGRFRRDRGYRMIERLCRFIEQAKAGLKIGFNHLGTQYFPDPVPEGLTCITLDFSTAGLQAAQGSLCAAFGSTSDKPSDVMVTIFNQGWGDWSPRTLGVIELSSAAIWARGARPYLGDRTHPENRLTSISSKAMAHMADVQKEMVRHYPAEDAQASPDILLLHGPRTMYGPNIEEFAGGSSGVLPLRGAHQLLIDAGCNLGAVAEAFLKNHLHRARLVVLPEMRAIEPDTERLLRGYVERGGSVLIVGKLPVCDGRELEWAGVARKDAPWQDHIYLPAWRNASLEDSVLVRGDFHEVTLKGAEMILPAIQPYDCRHGLRFGWGIAPPADQASEHPVLTKHSLGQGYVWYLEAGVFSDYVERGNWTQIDWMRGLLAEVLPNPLVRVETAGGAMEPVAHSNDATTWVFLIHHGAERVVGDGSWARVLGPVPTVPLKLELRDPAGRSPASVTLQGLDVPWRVIGDVVEIATNMDRLWSVLRVDWENR